MSENGKALKLTISLPPEIVERLKARQDTYGPSSGRPSEVPIEPLRKAASRYFALLERELRTCELTEAEALLVCDALNGTWRDWGGLGQVSARSALTLEIEDSIRLNNLDKKWGVDEGAFWAKASLWSEAQCLAVVDAVERFWAGCDDGVTVQMLGMAP